MSNNEPKPRLIQAARLLQPYEAVRRRMRAQGHLPAPGDKKRTVVIFASQRPGEGVSTLCRGVAMACATAGMGRVLAVSQAPDLTAPASPEQDPLSTITLSPSGLSDELSSIALRSALAADDANPAKVIEALKEDYDLIFIDGGTIDDDNFVDFRPTATRAILVIDLSRSKRRALTSLQHDISKMTRGFDGFIGNRFNDALPVALQNIAP